MNRRILYLVIGLTFVYSVGFSQSFLLKKGDVQSKDFLTEVEFELVRGHIIIPARINGKTYRFLFDTGAPNMFVKEIMSDNPMQKIELVDGNRQADSVGIGLVDRIQLGGIDFDGYGALEFDFDGFPFRCYNIDGIIGSNLFKGLVLKIDYEAKKLIITDHVRNLNPRTRPMKMSLVGDQLRPLIHLRLGLAKRSKEKVSFDSGFNGFYEVALEVFNASEPSEDIYTDVTKLTGKGSGSLLGVGESSVQYFTTISNFSVGTADFKGVMAVTANADVSKLGTALLKYGNVILDFKRKKFYFQETNEFIADPNKPKYIVSVEDERYVIGFVLDQVLKDKISVGDRIIKIDGVDITALTPCEMFMISSKAKKSILVKSSGGQFVKVII